jgi:hypothetical protein
MQITQFTHNSQDYSYLQITNDHLQFVIKPIQPNHSP